MMAFNSHVSPLTIHNHISVKTASTHSGYSQQYLRRLLRGGKLTSTKVGQLWLIDKKSFDNYFENAHRSKDKRFCSKLQKRE